MVNRQNNIEDLLIPIYFCCSVLYFIDVASLPCLFSAPSCVALLTTGEPWRMGSQYGRPTPQTGSSWA